MRWVRVLMVLVVGGLETACAGSPTSLGITGPGAYAPEPSVDDSLAPNPGVPNPTGTDGMPQRFYGYN